MPCFLKKNWLPIVTGVALGAGCPNVSVTAARWPAACAVPSPARLASVSAALAIHGLGAAERAPSLAPALRHSSFARAGSAGQPICPQ